MMTVQLIGRSSSHFTRVAMIFAHELGVPFELIPVYDLASVDPSAYGGNPTLKVPTLRTPNALVFGTENICRTLAELAGSNARVVWPEQIRSSRARNAQELVWHGMAAQVQLIVKATTAKTQVGCMGALDWLDENLAHVLLDLPCPRDLSLFEVTLFCLLDHIAFRGTLPLESRPALVRFSAEFATRPSARRTQYRYDTQPADTKDI